MGDSSSVALSDEDKKSTALVATNNTNEEENLAADAAMAKTEIADDRGDEESAKSSAGNDVVPAPVDDAAE